MNSSNDHEQVTIIGAGPAGIAAAIQLKRYNIPALLLEKDQVGGLLRNAWSVENYPGFPDGIPGTELIGLFKDHLEKAGVPVVFEEILDLDMKDERFLLETPSRRFSSDIVVVATGTRAKMFPTSAQAPGQICYEVYPLRNEREKHIAIIGAGDAAFDYALNLARHNTITVLGRSSKPRALPLLIEQASRNPSITYRTNTIITSISQGPRGKVILQGTKKGGSFELEADHLLCALGREPELNFLSPLVRDSLEHLTKSGILYLIGDVTNQDFRQVGIAVGDGIKAAMKIAKGLRKREEGV